MQVMRTTSLGLCSTSARVGSMAAPLLMYLSPSSSDPRPALASYGACMAAAALACVWLWPETARAALPDTMEEGEAAAAGINPWTDWCRCGKRTRLPQ